MKKIQKHIIGIDEAGRGPLAGPVAVAAVACRSVKIFRGVKDSKKLSETEREKWFEKFKEFKKKKEIDFSVSFSSAETIDKKGITKAIKLATTRAIRRLGLNPNNCQVFLDGTLYAPAEFKNQKTYIRGDDRFSVIASASVVAKVCRDRKMKRLAKKFPEYDFHIHKGYGTVLHYRRLKKYGSSEIHRHSFLKNFYF